MNDIEVTEAELSFDRDDVIFTILVDPPMVAVDVERQRRRIERQQRFRHEFEATHGRPKEIPEDRRLEVERAVGMIMRSHVRSLRDEVLRATVRGLEAQRDVLVRESSGRNPLPPSMRASSAASRASTADSLPSSPGSNVTIETAATVAASS